MKLSADSLSASWSMTKTRAQGFLVIEGVNGAGKTTLQSKIAEFATSQGRSVVTTREPGGTALGSKIRELSCGARVGVPICPLSEALLFSVDRAQHVHELIRPALKNRKLVVSDRYHYSTLAFQGYGRGFDLKTLENLCHLAIQDMLPDLVILLDLDPALGLRRNLETAGKGAAADSFEREDLTFHERLRKGFLNLAESCPEPFLVIDAAQSADAVWETAKPAIAAWVAAC